MSTFAETFCLDAPVGTDMSAVYRAFLAEMADQSGGIDHSRGVEGWVTTAPDGFVRLVVYGDSTFGARYAAGRVLETIGSGRLAVADNHDEFGAAWEASGVIDGVTAAVHRHHVIPVDPADDETVAEFITKDCEGKDPRAEDLRDHAAMTALATLYGVELAVVLAAETIADEAYQDVQVVGGYKLFPFWHALDLPWPGEPGLEPLHLGGGWA
jgi:hypothetical protein